MKITKFEDINIWKLALKITKIIYDISSQWKFSKDYWLKDQIRRATVSISSNIVEWFEKNNNNEFVRYLRISKWSCWEVRNQMYIALTINYINQAEFNKINDLLVDLSNQIGAFIVYLSKKKKEWEFISK